MYYPENTGYLKIITGPMFSEKSGTLINQVKKLERYGNKNAIVYKPENDNRFSKTEIVSRIGDSYSATELPTQITDIIIQKVLEDVKNKDVIAFDEVQFFSKNIMLLVSQLLENGKVVLAAGLNMDYRGREFGYIGGLMAMADEIVNLKAYCACPKGDTLCGKPANYTQRLINNKPVKSGPTVLIGDTETYEPRCIKCFVKPMKVIKH